MKKTLFYSLYFFAVLHAVNAQCIDHEQLKTGGDYGFVKYMFLVPSFSFGYKGDTSTNWNVLNGDIDIKQAPPKVLFYKKKIEKAILRYAGTKFFFDLKFIDVEVNYPERFKAFIDSGRPDIKHRISKAKYFYMYQFGPNDSSIYLIGVAVDKNGKIISPFNFPAKRYYKPIDRSFTYCKLLEIARNTDKNIDPIESVTLNYNSDKRKFYWLLTRKLTSITEGPNSVNKVWIDAENLKTPERSLAKYLLFFRMNI